MTHVGFFMTSQIAVAHQPLDSSYRRIAAYSLQLGGTFGSILPAQSQFSFHREFRAVVGNDNARLARACSANRPKPFASASSSKRLSSSAEDSRCSPKSSSALEKLASISTLPV